MVPRESLPTTLRQLLVEGAVDGSEKIVSMITGAGVKSVDNFQPVSLPTISANEVLEG